MNNQEPRQEETSENEAQPREPREAPSQEELRQRYLEQQRRMRCIGCGEGEEYF